jgi:hypothetical protein
VSSGGSNGDGRSSRSITVVISFDVVIQVWGNRGFYTELYDRGEELELKGNGYSAIGEQSLTLEEH